MSIYHRARRSTGCTLCTPSVVQIVDSVSKSPACSFGLKGFLRQFASTMGTECMLQELTIKCMKGPFLYQGFAPLHEIRSHYVLEPLALLREIKSVRIQGVDPGFACKLKEVMMGSKKRTLDSVEYGEQVFKRRKKGANGGKRMEVRRQAKKYSDPDFDWKNVLLQPFSLD